MLRVCGSFERAKASITTKRLATGSEDRLCNHSWYGLVCMVSCLLITLSMDHFSVSIPSKVKWVWCGTESNPCWGLACETVANSSLWRDNYFPSHILIELCMYQLALYTFLVSGDDLQLSWSCGHSGHISLQRLRESCYSPHTQQKRHQETIPLTAVSSIYRK